MSRTRARARPRHVDFTRLIVEGNSRMIYILLLYSRPMPMRYRVRVRPQFRRIPWA